MSNWVSDERGKWHPAKEVAGLKNYSDKPLVIEMTDDAGKKFKKTIPPGAPYTYEGPDRAAMFQWWEENGKPNAEQMKELLGNVTFGEDFRTNTEFMEQYAKFRNIFGFNNVEEYLTYLGYDSKKVHEKFLSKAAVITTHEAPARIAEIKMLGGGDDKANPGKNQRFGDFGEIPAV